MSVTLSGALVTLLWDLDVCIHFNNLTLVDVLSYENFIFHFVQTDTFTSFHKFLHQIIAMTTIAILVIGVRVR
jgi:hypothetical protein